MAVLRDELLRFGMRVTIHNQAEDAGAARFERVNRGNRVRNAAQIVLRDQHRWPVVMRQ